MANEILRTIPQNYKDLKISFCQEDVLLGTGGAIIKAVKDFKINKDFFILNGDTYFPIDLNEMKKYHTFKNADLTMAITSIKDTYRYGRVELNSDGKMKNIIKNREGKGQISGGIYFCHAKNFYALETKNCNLEIDIIMPLLENNKLVYCYTSSASFVDIGTEEGWLESLEIIPKEK
jgi:D-glycero-alpha-D-manno-heptose 1-phosphate guanylyltransferase